MSSTTSGRIQFRRSSGNPAGELKLTKTDITDTTAWWQWELRNREGRVLDRGSVDQLCENPRDMGPVPTLRHLTTALRRQAEDQYLSTGGVFSNEAIDWAKDPQVLPGVRRAESALDFAADNVDVTTVANLV